MRVQTYKLRVVYSDFPTVGYAHMGDPKELFEVNNDPPEPNNRLAQTANTLKYTKLGMRTSVRPNG